MIEKKLEGGTWEVTFDSKEDAEIHQFLIKMAEKNNIKPEGPDFDKMVNEMLEEALKNDELLDRIKLRAEKENSEKNS